ncbi:MAG: DUF1761 domain-containing protein [Chloroflexota bacterium]
MLDFNFLAIALATIAMTTIGAIWFNAPFAFQRIWLAGIGKTSEQVIADFSPIKPVLSLVGSAIMAVIFSVLLSWLAVSGVVAGIQVGLMVGLCAVIINGVRDAFEGRPLSLYFVNASHDLTVILVGAGIIGFFSG